MKKHLLLFGFACLLATSAQAAPITFTAVLTGPAEFPPVPSPGSGFTTVTYDPDTHLLGVDVTFANLVANTTQSHIHCCVSPLAQNPVAGVATTLPTFAGFPSGVTAGTYTNVLDLTLASSFSPGFITASGGTVSGAEARLAAEMLQGNTYLNIHTTMFPNGEIRGFLQQVPDSGGTLSLLGIAVSAVFAARRRTRRN